ncbi:MAG TPA: aldo/keto reductase [Acidimicrobiales bacterium]|nr:aldo/keto reductase [Acidimicrobiales bacterium]
MAANRTDRLSRIGLGCYALGGGYGNVTEADAGATVDAAIACGWTLVDTAESYLDSEYRLGRILKSRREDVFLATKVFPCEPYTEDNIVTAAEASLRRLQTDRIDLYQLHGPEDWIRPYATPLDEVAGALNRLVDEGKILRVGACNFPVQDLEELNKHVRLFSLQDLYGPLDPGAEYDLPNIPSVTRKLQFAADHGIAFLAYSPLARGLLSANPHTKRSFPREDERHYLPRYQAGVYEHFAALAQQLADWAGQRGRSLPELAIAWCLHNPTVTSVLVGAKSPEQVRQLANAESWTLSDDDVAFVDAAVSTLPDVAKEALVTIWDHFPEAAVDAMSARRRAALET